MSFAEFKHVLTHNIVDEVALALGENSSLRGNVSDAVLIRRYRERARQIVLMVLDNEAPARSATSRFDFVKEEHRIFKEALLQIEACHGSYRLGGSEKIIKIFEALDGLLHPTVETNKSG